jgi:hypothetical protein
MWPVGPQLPLVQFPAAAIIVIIITTDRSDPYWCVVAREPLTLGAVHP